MTRLFVNDLTVIDSSLFEPEHGIVGESWILDLMLDGELNEQSMLFDFGEVKRSVKRWVDENVDHKLILPAQNVHVSTSKEGDRLCFEGESNKGLITMSAPSSAFCLLASDQVDIESLTRHIEHGLLAVLPGNIGKVSVSLRHEQLQTAWYRYSHGLKKHAGNCQRIAHGHRSQIGIWLDDVRSHEQEVRWAERWQNIYLGTQEDLVALDALSFADTSTGLSAETHLGFRYSAEQGVFELAIPSEHVEMLESDTTVECLAEYIHSELKNQIPHQHIKVRAYEGVQKGAEYEG